MIYILQRRSQATATLCRGRRRSRCRGCHPGTVCRLLAVGHRDLSIDGRLIAVRLGRKLVSAAGEGEGARRGESLGLRRTRGMGLNRLHDCG